VISKDREGSEGSLRRFVQGSIYPVSGTLFSKYVCLFFDELLRIEYTKRSLFQISLLLMNKTRVCTEIITCPARIRRKTIRTLAIPRLPSINTTAFTKQRQPKGRRCTLTAHAESVHSSVAFVYSLAQPSSSISTITPKTRPQSSQTAASDAQ